MTKPLLILMLAASATGFAAGFSIFSSSRAQAKTSSFTVDWVSTVDGMKVYRFRDGERVCYATRELHGLELSCVASP